MMPLESLLWLTFPYSYLKAYQMVRDITGTGDGNGPMIAVHDGFTDVANWAGFLSGADRLALGVSGFSF